MVKGRTARSNLRALTLQAALQAGNVAECSIGKSATRNRLSLSFLIPSTEGLVKLVMFKADEV
ncbi:MAG: hypothetical protein QXN15_06190 [Candidatus Jordarchaeales archaeon]|nr:hypothetical protein [Candidatus Jordarchaeia archaeon]